MLRDLGTWFLRLTTAWAGFTTGGFLVAVLGTFSLWKDKPVPRDIGASFAILFFLMACFKVWRDEKIRADDVAKALTTLTNARPRISLFFDEKDARCFTLSLTDSWERDEKGIREASTGNIRVGLINRGGMRASGVSVVAADAEQSRCEIGHRFRHVGSDEDVFDAPPSPDGAPTDFIEVLRFIVLEVRGGRHQIRWFDGRNRFLTADDEFSLRLRVQHEFGCEDGNLRVQHHDGECRAMFDPIHISDGDTGIS